MTGNSSNWPRLLCGLFLISSVQAGLPPAEVPLAENLARTAARAVSGCRPLLLEFAAEYCEYCQLLEEEILKPIRRNRDYDHRLVMRKIMLGDSREIIDFDGSSTDAQSLSRRYRVFVTPTLLFVDQQGHELAERMIGVTTIDFYGGYLDLALDSAREKLKQRGDCRQQSDDDKEP